MVRTPFVPARSSQHRAAALALYRALAKSAAKVQVPAVTTGQSQDQKPLHSIIRHQFRRNSIDTSSRLVFASLAAGYQLLELLGKAQVSDSPEHKQIVQQLRQIRAPPTRTAKPNIPAEPRASRPPLLTKISKPDEPPKYASTIYPRPKSSLRGPRRVPMMATTTDGQPFLRTSSPQSAEMSRMIGLKSKLYLKYILKIGEIQDEILPDCALEDSWDAIVRRQLRDEGLLNDAPGAGYKPESSYAWSAHLSRLWYEWKMEDMWQDWIARGEALQRIVEEEQALADEEAGRPSPSAGSVKPAQRRSAADVVATSQKLMSMIPAKTKANHDVFSSQAWADLVRSKTPKMKSWIEADAPRTAGRV